MPAYAYRAVDSSGKRIRGRKEASNPPALKRMLEKRGLLVVRLKQSESTESAQLNWRRRSRDVVTATAAIAPLLRSGLPVTPALTTAANICSGRMGEILMHVRARIERGDAVADAFSTYPQFFGPLYVGLVRAGEMSGDLAAAFSRLAEHLERQAELRSRLASALIYPILLASFGAIAIGVILLFVLPRFVEVLRGAGAELPWATAFLLNVSSLTRERWPIVLATFFGIAICAHQSRRSSTARRTMSAVIIQLPVVGALRRKLLAGRFARLSSVMLRGGAPLLIALDGVAKTVTDPLARDEVARIRRRVREGIAVHAAIDEGSLFPDELSRLIAVGESSGRLGEFFDKSADHFERETARSVERLMILFEPAIIVLFGGIVGLVALSLLQAVYGVNAGSFQ